MDSGTIARPEIFRFAAGVSFTPSSEKIFQFEILDGRGISTNKLGRAIPTIFVSLSRFPLALLFKRAFLNIYR
jgi:hypothetical protein